MTHPKHNRAFLRLNLAFSLSCAVFSLTGSELVDVAQERRVSPEYREAITLTEEIQKTEIEKQGYCSIPYWMRDVERRGFSLKEHQLQETHNELEMLCNEKKEELSEQERDLEAIPNGPAYTRAIEWYEPCGSSMMLTGGLFSLLFLGVAIKEDRRSYRTLGSSPTTTTSSQRTPMS